MKKAISWWPVSVAAVVVIGVTVMMSASPAGACSCLAFEDAVRMSNPSAAFIGEVVDEQPVAGSGEAQVALLYEVETVYRGEVPSEVVVRTPADTGGGCGLGFRGRTAVLAFVERGGELTTSICSAVAVGEGDAVVESLLEEAFGPARSPAPVDGVERSDQDTGLPSGFLIGAGAFAFALVGSSVLVFRRHG